MTKRFLPFASTVALSLLAAACASGASPSGTGSSSSTTTTTLPPRYVTIDGKQVRVPSEDGNRPIRSGTDQGQQVIIYSHSFAPSELFANKGTIVFTNLTDKTQRVTILDYPSVSAPARSGPIAPGATWSLTVQNVIALTYHGSNGSGGILNVGQISGL